MTNGPTRELDAGPPTDPADTEFPGSAGGSSARGTDPDDSAGGTGTVSADDPERETLVPSTGVGIGPGAASTGTSPAPVDVGPPIGDVPLTGVTAGPPGGVCALVLSGGGAGVIAEPGGRAGDLTASPLGPAGAATVDLSPAGPVRMRGDVGVAGCGWRVPLVAASPGVASGAPLPGRDGDSGICRASPADVLGVVCAREPVPVLAVVPLSTGLGVSPADHAVDGSPAGVRRGAARGPVTTPRGAVGVPTPGPAIVVGVVVDVVAGIEFVLACG